jgi:hypothetical protein
MRAIVEVNNNRLYFIQLIGGRNVPSKHFLFIRAYRNTNVKHKRCTAVILAPFHGRRDRRNSTLNQRQVGAAITCPLEVVKTRLQSSLYKSSPVNYSFTRNPLKAAFGHVSGVVGILGYWRLTKTYPADGRNPCTLERTRSKSCRCSPGSCHLFCRI